MLFDIRTLFIFSVPLFGAFALTTFYLWRSHEDIEGIGHWTIGFTLLSVAGILFALRHVLHDALTIVTANSLCVLGYILFFDGISLFARQRSRRHLNYITLAVLVVLLIYFGLIDANLSARIIAISFILAFIFFHTSYLAFWCRKDDEREILFFISVLFSGIGLLHLVRIPITLLINPGLEFLRSNIYQSFYISLYVLGSTLIAISLILLLSSRLSSIQLKAKTSLAESETRFKQLANATFEGIVIHEAGKVLDCNEMALKMFRYNSEEALGENGSCFIAPEYRDMVEKNIAEGNEDPYEAVCLRKDQTTFYAEIHGKAAQYKGIPVRVVAIRDITERKEAEAALRHALKEKETLLKEIHHRVKNNMQTISSLLTLQARDEGNEKVDRIVSESKARIHTMAMVHEMLYMSESLAEIEFGSYLENLIAKIKTALIFDHSRIVIKLEAEKVVLSHDQAIACALSITELITNSIEHAFPDGRSGEIFIEIRHSEGKEVLIRITDNGIGIHEEAEPALKAASLGLSLIESLVVDQLDGSFQMEAASDGTQSTIRFTKGV